MTYISIVDVVDNDALKDALDENTEPLLHKCGREIEEGHGLNELQTRTSKGMEVANFDNQNSSVELMNSNSRYREDIVMPLKLHGIGRQNDWDEVIRKVGVGK